MSVSEDVSVGLFDKVGKVGALIMAGADGGIAEFCGKNNKKYAAIRPFVGGPFVGGGGVYVLGDNGNAALFSDTFMLIGGNDDKLRVAMGVNEYGHGVVQTWDKDGVISDILGGKISADKSQEEYIRKPREYRPSASTSSTIEFEKLDGVAIIVADDGQYLGKISSNAIDSDSIMNSIGRYGSEISSTSIFNEVGRYGGKISSMSPFNDITSRPPKIFVGEEFIAYLTTNSLKTPRVDPYALIGYLKSKR
jgi:hypothetical protein